MMCIVTMSDTSTNYTDEFLGIWPTQDDAQAWFDNEYTWAGDYYDVHVERDIDWVGSAITAFQVTRIYKPKGLHPLYVSFILPNS